MTNGTIIWVFPRVPSVPDSRSGLSKRTQRESTYFRASTLSRALQTKVSRSKNASENCASVSGPTFASNDSQRTDGFIDWIARTAVPDLL